MIEARHLTKRYGHTVAVDEASFVVRPGRVTGFLGPNGRKSTTMRMILGLDMPSSGSVLVNGQPYRELADPLRSVGALLDAKAIVGGRSAAHHLLWLADSNGITRRRVGEVLDIAGLSDVAGQRVGTFSLGMNQRLGIAAALLGDPETLLFDEPINGLDPDGILWIRNLMKSLAAQGRTVFLSSHLMSETFGELLRQVSGKGRGIKEHVQHIMQERYRGDEALSDACYQAFSRFCSAQERTLSSIVTTMTAPLLIFQNTYVDAATSATDFDVSRVRKERMTIYVGIPANMMSSASLIVNLFFSHLINQNMKELPEQNPELKHKCLVLLDEFSTLGRVGIIAKSIGQIAGYNMLIMPIIQGISQLIGVYGEHDARTIEDMAVAQILYPPRSQKDANEYSEMLGYSTEKAVSTGISRPRAWGGNNGSASENVSDQRRALMLPQELREMPWTQEIIITTGIKPILCDKALYFSDPVFMNRLKALSPTLKAINGLPTEDQLKAVALTKRELSIKLPQIDVHRHAAKVERRTRVVKEGEEITAENLTTDTSALPAIEPGDEVRGALEFVDAFFERADPDGKTGNDGLPRMAAMWEPASAPMHVPELDEQRPMSEEDKMALMAQMFGDDRPAPVAPESASVMGFAAELKQAREERAARGAGHGYMGVIDLGALAEDHEQAEDEGETYVATAH